jgi:cellulose synthase/poly-beta-1,6-N-acetylglucosamine synthase-like glycosyltransferase
VTYSDQISIIVPAHNEEQCITNCLQSIRDEINDSATYELIVVADSCTDRTEKIAAEFTDSVISVQVRNRAAARNAGAAKARGALLVFIDADSSISHGWLDSMQRIFKNPAIAAAQSSIVPCQMADRATITERLQTSIHSASKTSLLPDELIFPAIYTAGAMYRRDAFEALNGFNEELWDFEDIDLSWRLLYAGFVLCHEPAATLFSRFNPPTIRHLCARLTSKGAAWVALKRRWRSAPHMQSAGSLLPAPISQIKVREQLNNFFRTGDSVWLLTIFAKQLVFASGCISNLLSSSVDHPAPLPLTLCIPRGSCILPDGRVLRVSEHIRLYVSADFSYVFNLSDGPSLAVDPITSLFLNALLTENLELEKISARIQDTFDVDQDTVMTDIQELLPDLIEHGVLFADSIDNRAPLRVA